MEAVNCELDSLDRAGTWKMGDKVEGGNEGGSKWVLKVKRLADGRMDRFKAPLVTQSFTQCPGFDLDNTEAPVICFDSLQVLLAIMVVECWRPQHVDVKSAFFYGHLREEIYMNPPKVRQEKGNTARLEKYIYGLKQSCQYGYMRLTQHFITYRFVTSNFDHYVLKHKTEESFIAIYMDNITLYGPYSPMMNTVKNTLKSEFEVIDIADLHWL
jgi:hypothetical protein